MPSPSGKDATTLPSPGRWLVRSQALFVIVSSLVAGILTWVILGLLVKIAKETDVPLPDSLGDLEWKGVPRQRYESLCDELGLGGLKERPHRWVD